MSLYRDRIYVDRGSFDPHELCAASSVSNPFEVSEGTELLWTQLESEVDEQRRGTGNSLPFRCLGRQPRLLPSRPLAARP